MIKISLYLYLKFATSTLRHYTKNLQAHHAREFYKDHIRQQLEHHETHLQDLNPPSHPYSYDTP
ncbi:MAG: hypothetical protein [CRESS virus sp. ct1Gc25]|nr:MAG: hypothetical protein [CRESS virus sp. ct1Gc25]